MSQEPRGSNVKERTKGDPKDRPIFFVAQCGNKIYYNLRNKIEGHCSCSNSALWWSCAIFFSWKTKSSPSVKKAQNNFIILISIDTTRADAIGVYGNEQIKTPIIDSFARDGELFSETP